MSNKYAPKIKALAVICCYKKNELHYNGLMTDWGLIPEVGK